MIIPFTLFAASTKPPPPVWFALGFPCFFVGMWLLVTFIISRSGWARFGEAYPCPERPSGTSYAAPFARFGTAGARYNNVVRAVATEGGLYLRPVIFFRAFHTPFLLPWSSIKQIDHIDRWFVKGYHLQIQDPVGSFQIRFKSSIEGELRRYVPKLLNTPAPSTFPFIK
ncbi:hypothetical protein [Prosthecobacter sp.]|uniref:hypothetical protein n=1 Tax=Prosthecobacter sp. TaxID=1965333 RepID=UPI003782D9F3